MSATIAIALISFIVAISIGVIAWFFLDLGTVTLLKYRSHFTQQAHFQVQEFFLFIDPQKLFIVNIAVMILGALLIWIITGSPYLTVPTFFLLALFPRLLYRSMRKQRLKKFEQQLPDALMLLAGGLHAGVGISSAISQLTLESEAPIAQEFGLMMREQRLGLSLDQCLSNLNRRMPTQTTTLIVSAIRIASETGGSLAETLERTSHTIRSRLQMERKIGALTAQGKLQAWVVGMLPMMLMGVLNKMEPEAMSLLWHTRVGWATLAVIFIFEFLGVLVIRKIVTIDV
jgi:tight adherence protein B